MLDALQGLLGGIAAALVIRCLRNARDACRLRMRNLRIDPAILKRMLWIGLPAGIQGMFFSLSNITIQSSVNSLASSRRWRRIVVP